jgi:hypothetical protein
VFAYLKIVASKTAHIPVTVPISSDTPLFRPPPMTPLSPLTTPDSPPLITEEAPLAVLL